jgi:hypothetical protein
LRINGKNFFTALQRATCSNARRINSQLTKPLSTQINGVGAGNSKLAELGRDYANPPVRGRVALG